MLRTSATGGSQEVVGYACLAIVDGGLALQRVQVSPASFLDVLQLLIRRGFSEAPGVGI